MPPKRRQYSPNPTVNELVPVALAACTENTAALYKHYLDLFAERHGEHSLESIRASDVQTFARWVQAMSVRRRSSVDGRSAAEHAISAVRKLFQIAIADGVAQANPALQVAKPKRHPSRRTPLTDSQVNDVFGAVSDDETQVIRFLLETGCRREGLVGMTPRLFTPVRQTVTLDEKGSKIREQPISEVMALALGSPDCPIYHVTRRRLDGLWSRVRRKLPWADHVGLSTHFFRHTAITRVEQATGSYALAAAFAGHDMQGTTGTYVAININDVAWAFSVTFQVPHPLAAGSSRTLPRGTGS